LQFHSNRGTQEMASFISWGNQFYTIIRTQLQNKNYAYIGEMLERKTREFLKCVIDRTQDILI